MFSLIEQFSRAGFAFYTNAKTDHVRALIKKTRFDDRHVIKDLLRLERYAINHIHEPMDAMDLRTLMHDYSEAAEMIFTEVEEKRHEILDRDRDALLTAELEQWRQRIERDSWTRAGGLE